MSAVEIEKKGRIAVLSINNPPVNGLGFAVRSGLMEAVQAALADDTVDGIVITGAGRMFSGGADITEFNTPKSTAQPRLTELLNAIEMADKPVVAAIHGVAAGGGLETALGCHYRIAAPDTRLGLPEVTLGIIPGAGGTQRLPRLTGIEAALQLISSGELVKTEKAHALGFVDEIAEDDLVAAGIAAAERLAAQGGEPRRCSALDDKVSEARGHPEIFDTFTKSIARRARGFEAPYACIEAIKCAVDLPFEEGLAQEREIFKRCVESVQSKAQRHVFFAEREVAKIPDVPKDTVRREISTAAIIGAGTMGGGIAMNFLNAGIPVTLLEADKERLDAGIEVIKGNYANTVAKGRLAQDAMDKRMSALTGTTTMSDIADADLVIEAVFENLDLKKQIFAELDGICKPGAILATNTSTLDVNVIANATSRPGDVLGMHFFSPANVMRLLENVRGAATEKDVIATVMDLSRRIGKVAALVGVCDGFVGNRMLEPYLREAGFLLEEGALPQQVDKVIFDFGFPMGPFAMTDLAGADVGWRIRQERAPTRPNHLRYSDIGDRICEQGRFGQKTGAGYYRYESGKRDPIPDPDIEALIIETSKQRGIERRDISDQEILERCMYPLINEGAKILEEGLALRASDIDVIWIHGYGFPRYRGGPMFYADTIGLDTIYQTMCRLHEQHGELLEPAPLLKKLAAEGRGFSDI
jgi:3-hydroxyacyl-CoA dehydrogenase